MILFHVFFFNDTATTEIYTLSLHDALPICAEVLAGRREPELRGRVAARDAQLFERAVRDQRGRRERGLLRRERSEEHTSELQSRQYLVCRLLLEKKKDLFT